ncbi:hypothetical protein GQ473_01160 [archaeon]|nr:hypothetical protein [archaeon]
MDITSIMFLINAKKTVLEEKLKNDERIEEFEMEELDKNDQRKDVMIILKTPINHKYLTEMLLSIVDGVEEKAINVE